jgi:cephalosporin hydroxylase
MTKQINHFWESVFGWFGPSEVSYYKSILDKFSGPAHFVEVGCFKGKSSSFMAVEIINSGKNIKFDCVDTWLGSDEHLAGGPHEEVDAVAGRLYEVFIENMKPVEGFYTPVRLPSVEASKLYQDESLDFVFIDADHSYESVCADISAWLPKMKKGGIISGHDCYYPPVERAVNELLTNVEIHGGCWHHVVV